MKQITTNRSRGLTLTELLAVLLIISLISTIAVPVYVARQEDARVRVAMGECRQIAHAEETVAAMHGFYVPFQLLDELPADPDDMGANDEERIDLYPPGLVDPYLIIPTIRAEEQIGDQFRLRLDGYGSTGNPRVRALIDNWSGPFITYHRFWYDVSGLNYNGPTDPRYRTDDDMFRDFPLDPWGNPYRFYSPLGIIGGSQDHEGDEFRHDDPVSDFSSGELRDLPSDEQRFQKYAVVSYGRDGISDEDPSITSTTYPPNDIFYEFGTDGVSRRFGQF